MSPLQGKHHFGAGSSCLLPGGGGEVILYESDRTIDLIIIYEGESDHWSRVILVQLFLLVQDW